MGAVGERLGDVHLIDGYDVAEPQGRPADRLRREGELEADRRELHGVLPLRDDPPRADRGAARVRRRAGRAGVRGPRGRVRRGDPGLHGRRLRGPGPDPRHHRRPGPALLRDHDQAERLHQPRARPRDPAPDVPGGAGPHDRRVRLALPAVGRRRRPRPRRLGRAASTGSTCRTSTPASAASRRWARASTPTAAS